MPTHRRTQDFFKGGVLTLMVQFYRQGVGVSLYITNLLTSKQTTKIIVFRIQWVVFEHSSYLFFTQRGCLNTPDTPSVCLCAYENN